MKLLFTGNGKSGSWKIRGEQIGDALNAIVKPHATKADFKNVDLVIAVKRITEQTANDLKKTKWIWDIVDSYPQPECVKWDKEKSIKWAKSEIERLNPSAIIWPNNKMKDDVGFSGISIVIPHHARPGLKINRIRESIKYVGYEGSLRYILDIEDEIKKECKHRGWSFINDAKNICDLDVVIAMRSKKWDGYATRHWKSNVKLANAHASGTPFIGAKENGYLETASGCEYWADDIEQMKYAFDMLESQSTRQLISDRFLTCSISIEQVTQKYLELIRAL